MLDCDSFDLFFRLLFSDFFVLHNFCMTYYNSFMICDSVFAYIIFSLDCASDDSDEYQIFYSIWFINTKRKYNNPLPFFM